MEIRFVVVKGQGLNPTQMYYIVTIPIKGKPMVQLDPGTVLERTYKGNKIKVKVLKDGTFSFNGKTYEDRSSLMKAILKGKTGQFTNFFKIGKGYSEEDAPNGRKFKVENDTPEISTDDTNDTHPVINSLDAMIRGIVKEELSNLFRGGNNA